MNTFISPNNQKLLWQTISQSPLFSAKPQKEEWFRNIIGEFYESNKLNTMITLKEINVATIKFMMAKLKEGAGAPHPQNTVTSAPYTKQDISNMRKNDFEAKLRVLENEHQNLLKLDVPPEIDFRDKTDEGPIANLGDLIKMEIEKRNREISEYALKAQPPPQAIPHITAPLPSAHDKKTVSWNDTVPPPTTLLPPTPPQFDAIQPIKKEMLEIITDTIKKEMIDLREQIARRLERELFDLKKFFKVEMANRRDLSIDEPITISETNPMWDVVTASEEHIVASEDADTVVVEVAADVSSSPISDDSETSCEKIDLENQNKEPLVVSIPDDTAEFIESPPKAPRNSKRKKRGSK